jgi:hypothetical protein
MHKSMSNLRFLGATAFILIAIVTASVGFARSKSSQQSAKEGCENQLFNDMSICDTKPSGTFYDSKAACQARARSSYAQCLRAAGIIVRPGGTHLGDASNKFGTSTPTPTPIKIKPGIHSSVAPTNVSGARPTPTPTPTPVGHKRKP